MNARERETADAPFTIEDPERARYLADLFMVLLSVTLFVRGYEAHVGVAVVMAVILSVSIRGILEMYIISRSEGEPDLRYYTDLT